MQDVREKVQQVRAAFRPEVKEPLIQRFNPDDQPIVSIAVRSDIRSVRDLTTLADQIIVKRLQTVRDVGRATIAGGVKRQINIELDPGRMHALRVGVNDVMTGDPRREPELPGRQRPARQRRPRDRGHRPRRRARQLRRPDRRPPRPRARSICARSPPWSTASRSWRTSPLLNGERALAIDVVKTQGANTIEVARGVRRAVDELQKSLPPDVKLEIVRDSSRGIQNSVNNVQQTMVEGGLLTIAIVFLFLHSWRSTVITGLALPISVFGAFMVMAAFGFTLNVLTLMALSLAIGILIDDAIVVRENIMRHIGFGKTHRQAAHRRHQRDRAGGAGHHLLHRRGVPAGRLHGRHHRPLLLPVRHHGLGRRADLAVRVLHARPDAVVVWYDPQAHGTGRFARIVNGAQERANRVYRAILGWALRWPQDRRC